ncbi:MAG TPA: hypothetical protein PKE06_05595 [Flavilitoribacter sp.]|mgnify:CR=1 FL=1|nr:hypothetical protein [Flavilitoribacter sp.]HMQ87560.1 hypothetical protein [Flavilitoribacter sp.]
MKNSIVLVIMLALVFGCTKEKLSFSPIPEDETLAYRSEPAGPPAELGPNFCPELVDQDCSNPQVTYAILFGGIFPDPFTPAAYGKLDKYLNCPPIPIENCQKPCQDVVLEFASNVGYPWLRVWYAGAGGNPCEDFNFSAAEQQAIANDAKALALAYAPYCPGTAVKMKPVLYDTFWNYIVSGDNQSYFLGMYVRYTAPCRAAVE